jgi:hypothetical protein
MRYFEVEEMPTFETRRVRKGKQKRKNKRRVQMGKRKKTNIHRDRYREFEKAGGEPFTPRLTRLRELNEQNKNRTGPPVFRRNTGFYFTP